MRQILTRPEPEAPTLQMDVERAGLAWACPFSSSDEFEAAVIRSRRRAGAFGPSRSRRYALYSAYATVAVAVTGILYFVI